MTDALLSKMWSQSVNQLRGNTIRVKCLSPVTLYIRELNKTFTFGSEQTITVAEYNSSKELQGAISKNLLIITKDNVQDIPKQTPLQKPTHALIDQDMLRSMVTEVASEMVQQILQKLPVSTQTQIIQQIQAVPQSVEQKLQAVEIEEEHFIKMNDEPDVESNSNLSSQVEKKSMATTQVLSSLAKLKGFKKNSDGKVIAYSTIVQL